jgi:NodT family efflux transporter outer membrane factor (OMF) lipoprotein
MLGKGPQSRWSVPGIVLLFLSACAVGPNYKQPNVAVQPKWEAAPSTQRSVVDETTPPADWWETLNDPTLNWLVSQAWHQNLDVKIAVMRIREARALRGEAEAGFYPTLTGAGDYGFFRNAGPLFPVNTHDYQFYALGFDSAWELDVFGGIRRSVEASQANLDAQRDAAQGAVVSTVAEVARAYIELRTAQERSSIAEENVRTQRQTLELAKRLYAAGLVGQLDVTRAQAEVTTTESLLPVLQIQEKTAIHELGILLGESPTALTAQLTARSAVPPAPRRVPIGLPSDLLKRRPDVRQVERELASATAEIGVAEAELYPQFTINGDIALGAAPPDINIFNWGNRAYSIGPSVRWELFQGGRILANIDAHKAIRQELLDQYKLTILRAIGEVEDSLIAFQRQQDQFDLLRQSVDSNEASVRISKDQYSQGTVGFLTVLDAQRTLLVTQDALAVSRGDIDLSMIALYKAVGGGWEWKDRTAGAEKAPVETARAK